VPLAVAPPLHFYFFANHFREELKMTYQEKKFRDKADKQNQKGSKEDDQFKREAGSRISEAEESGNLKSPRDDDSEVLDDEDEDDVY
jgi:hypothetical protein